MFYIIFNNGIKRKASYCIEEIADIISSIVKFQQIYVVIHRSYFAVRPRPQLIRGGTVQGPTQATLLAQIAGMHFTNHQSSVALFVGFFPLTTIILHPEMKGECLLLYVSPHYDKLQNHGLV